jgi:thiamine-phosphate pyrophosphorylase
MKGMNEERDRRAILQEARLYLLITAQTDDDAFRRMVVEYRDGGADVLQLRDKNLSDAMLLQRALTLVELTRESRTLSIINDRPDIAILAGADGVHLGQEDLPAAHVRRLVGNQVLIGVSTHSVAQAVEAVELGADYIGVGPTFPSRTKQFTEFTGLPLLREVASRVSVPAFAIGGIDRHNLAQVVATGIRRIAVSAAVQTAADLPPLHLGVRHRSEAP